MLPTSSTGKCFLIILQQSINTISFSILPYVYIFVTTKQNISKMKKVISAIAAVALFGGAAFTTTSCNKERDWNCKCTDSNGNEETTILRGKTRTEAKAECDKKINILGYTRTCNIDYL